MILILTDKFDKHADIVCNKLKGTNFRYFRFDLDTESLKGSHITFRSGDWTISQNGVNVSAKTVDAVWARRAFVELSLEETNINESGFKIWRGEWNKTLLGLYNSLKNIKWLNPLAKSYQAENKYLQTERAKEVGFATPPSIVSNEKTELINFAEAHGEVVMKLMNQEFYQVADGEFKGIYVNKVSASDLTDFEDIGENPIVLQAYINKAYEVRYTVVDEDHLVCKIESQKSGLANVDWRRYDIPNTPHHSIQPPIEIKEKINQYMQSLDLKFGAMDFIVTPTNEWYFLEINTMGQWLWIEDLTGLKISDSIIKFLSTSQKEEG